MFVEQNIPNNKKIGVPKNYLGVGSLRKPTDYLCSCDILPWNDTNVFQWRVYYYYRHNDYSGYVLFDRSRKWL